jgi:hypothetical protein
MNYSIVQSAEKAYKENLYSLHFCNLPVVERMTSKDNKKIKHKKSYIDVNLFEFVKRGGVYQTDLCTIVDNKQLAAKAVFNSYSDEMDFKIATPSGFKSVDLQRFLNMAMYVGHRNKKEPLLSAKIRSCRGCDLRNQASWPVPFVGSLHAKMMFVGRNPGQDENNIFIPFVGRSGKMIVEFITKSLKVQRKDIYITNMVKCFTTRNNKPDNTLIEK